MKHPTSNDDYRQRFFVKDSPVRGEVVKLTDSYRQVLDKKPYPPALKSLLGELLAAACLLAGTLKIKGRLSIQLQANDNQSPLRWAMAECSSTGSVRALAEFCGDWEDKKSAKEAFLSLGLGVLFINLHQDGKDYQGIVEKTSDSLADCLSHYQKQSAQIPTFIKLASKDGVAAGILLQKLPQNASDKDDKDLWQRMQILAHTLKDEEMTCLDSGELLHRLYHEEAIVLPDSTPISFACTCSYDKSQSAIINLGQSEADDIIAKDHTIVLDCGFCGASYRFDGDEVARLFARH